MMRVTNPLKQSWTMTIKLTKNGEPEIILRPNLGPKQNKDQQLDGGFLYNGMTGVNNGSTWGK